MNRMLTRFALYLLVLCLVLPLAAVASEQPDAFVVASTTGISGEFMSGMWGNNSVDVDARILLHDYPTTIVNLDESVVINSIAVKAHTVTRDGDDNVVYLYAAG